VKTTSRVAQFRGRLLQRFGPLLPEQGVKTTTAQGVVMYLHPADQIENMLIKGYEYEPDTTKFMRRNLRAGDGAVLAGVNVGLHVIIAGLSVGDAGRVLGVEPQPRALLRAQRNINANNVAHRIALVSAALGDTAGIVRMAWSALFNAGAVSLYDEGPSFDVPMVRLETVVERLESRPFRMLLLDVQGYELPALTGLSPSRLPDIAIVELDDDYMSRSGVPPARIADELHRLGYELFDIRGRAVTSLDKKLHELNLVALKDGVPVSWT
jgi:FkbM family methyltransferase